MPSSVDKNDQDLMSVVIRADAIESDVTLRLAYHLECTRFGIDPRLGLQSPLHYGLEVASRTTHHQAQSKS